MAHMYGISLHVVVHRGDIVAENARFLARCNDMGSMYESGRWLTNESLPQGERLTLAFAAEQAQCGSVFLDPLQVCLGGLVVEAGQVRVVREVGDLDAPGDGVVLQGRDVVHVGNALFMGQECKDAADLFRETGRTKRVHEINEQLQTEYGTFLSTKSIQFEHDSYGYTILSPQRVVMGVVGLFVTKEENSPNGYSVQVQYTDTANLRVHERQQSDDN